jgi:hypothetical protein
MAIAAAVAVIAISFLAADALLDLSSGGFARRFEAAQASISDAAVSQHQLAIAIQAWARRSSLTRHSMPL